MLDKGLDRKRKHYASLNEGVLDAAAALGTPDAVAKMAWLLFPRLAKCRLRDTTIEAAASSGDQGRLEWLDEVGCCLRGWGVLRTAMQHAGLAVVKWLVVVARSDLPRAAGWVAGAGPGAGPTADQLAWADLLQAAATGSDAVAKLQWLCEQAGPQLGVMHVSLHQDMTLVAVRAGRVEAVRQLLSYWGPSAVLAASPGKAEHAAAASGSSAMAAFVRGVGVAFGPNAYHRAAEAGSVDMVRWLVHEAGVPVKGVCLREVLHAWPDRTHADARGLLEAVQLLVGAGHVSWSHHMEVAVAARRGDLALVQYLVHKHQHLEQQYNLVRAAPPGNRSMVAWAAVGGWWVVWEGVWTVAERGSVMLWYLSTCEQGSSGVWCAADSVREVRIMRLSQE